MVYASPQPKHSRAKVFAQVQIQTPNLFFVGFHRLRTTATDTNKQQQLYIYKSLYLTVSKTVHRIARPQQVPTRELIEHEDRWFDI